MLLSLVALTIASQRADIPLTTGVGISGVSAGGRAPAPVDTVQNLIVQGTWKQPKAGDKIAGARGQDRAWEEIKANKDGVFEGGPTRGGYVDIGFDSDAERPMLLVATGDTMVYINGVPRAGDPYGYGYLKVPFELKKGHNEFLFSCGRGSLKASLAAADSPQMLDTGDLTLPDILIGEKKKLLGAVVVINSDQKEVGEMSIGAQVGSGPEAKTKIPKIGPMTLRKCGFDITYGDLPVGDQPLHLKLYRSGKLVSQSDSTLSVRKTTEHFKRTFISQIDGSVQYFGVCPALKPSKDNALIMTVHGASVEGIGQARAYTPKDWCTIVAPTNRRPYGFDWEDWGRMDAMEVWNIAKKEFPHDPKRVILTGHSMGGHGAWTLGLTYPNEFAAVGPSAGWISFWSYAGGWTPRDPNPVEDMLRRSMNSSDTLLMLNNAKMEDIFILHGDKDDNVPVEQAREMKQKLTDIGAHFEYHEEPGAGHWWGNQCVDWPPMFDLFEKARKPQSLEPFSFTTVNPGVSATSNGFTILQQIEPLMPSRIDCEREGSAWKITAVNVRRFVLNDSVLDTPHFTINGQNFSSDNHERSQPEWLRTYTLAQDPTGRSAGYWNSGRESGLEKSPKLSGPFKLAFTNRMVFVVGTHGTAEENEWAANKARFDAETWYYKGNGAVDIIRDDEIGKYKDRNLILFGNADTNSAFKLIKNAPFQLSRGKLVMGDKTYLGEDKALVYLYPEGKRLVAVVGGTGLIGMRYTDRMPYFTSGVAYPDWTILSPEVLTKGSKAVEGAGFFGNDWKFDPAQSAFLSH